MKNKLNNYFLVLTLLFMSCIINAQAQNIDSLKIALKNAKHDTTRCNILSILAETANDEEWPAFNEQLKNLAEKKASQETNGRLKLFYLKHLASGYNNMGFLNQSIGDNNKAIGFYEKSIKIQEKIKDDEGLAYTLTNMGAIFDSQGNIPKALECYHRSLRIHEKLQNKRGIAFSLNSLGLVYSVQGDNSKALEYCEKSLKIREELNDHQGISTSLNNLGSFYFSNKNITKALGCYERALKITEKIHDKRGIAYALNGIGTVYHNQGNDIKALEYHNRCLTIQEQISDKSGIVSSLNNIAMITLKRGQVNEAYNYASKSLTIANEIGFPEYTARSAATLKNIFTVQRKYKEAFGMYELEIKMRDSINNQENQKAIVRKQMQYAYEKKELEAKAEQDKKDTVAKAELNQKENERNYFIIGFGLVVILAIFILRGYYNKQKANKIIIEQKKLVDKKQKELLDSIQYAKRIQIALMPSEKFISKTLDQLRK